MRGIWDVAVSAGDDDDVVGDDEDDVLTLSETVEVDFK